MKCSLKGRWMMNWHLYSFKCPQCQYALMICTLEVSTDGNIRLKLYCPKCQKDYQHTTTMVELTMFAMNADKTRYQPINVFTSDDLAFL